MFRHLPGTAAEDMALAAGIKPAEIDSAARDAEIAAIRDQVLDTLTRLSCSPLSMTPAIHKVHQSSEEETDISDDDNGDHGYNDE